MENNGQMLVYSSSPHKKAPRTTRFIMINVCVALIPACIAGIIFFGYLAAIILALSLISAVISEFVYLLICGMNFKKICAQFDFTSCVTGLLVGLTIGVNYPLYAPVLGSMFAIIVVKMFFGGTGKNLVNPAIAGRIFIFISFQSVVTEWILPSGNPVTGATELTGMLESGNLSSLSLLDMFLGRNLAGCIGETCKLALIIGAVYLCAMRIIDIRFPLIYIAVTGLFTVALNGFNFAYFLPSILLGGLIIGAFFMATDYVTTPNTKAGNYIYFFLLGILTAGLRQATGMETVSFAILLMNLLIPLIDKIIINKPFGFTKTKKKSVKDN